MKLKIVNHRFKNFNGCIGVITGEDELQYWIRFLPEQFWSGGASVSKTHDVYEIFE